MEDLGGALDESFWGFLRKLRSAALEALGLGKVFSGFAISVGLAGDSALRHAVVWKLELDFLGLLARRFRAEPEAAINHHD